MGFGSPDDPGTLGGGGGEGEGPIGPSGGGPPEIPGGGDGEPSAPEGGDDGPRAAGDLEWRRRARDAEDRLTRLEEELRDAKTSLESARMELESSERRRSIDAALLASDVIDLDTARLLVERAMEAMDLADAEATVRQIRHEKPFLFHAGSSAGDGGLGGGGFGSPAMASPDAGSGLMALAEQARLTGDRQVLLRYLRARRATP